MLPYLRFFLFL